MANTEPFNVTGSKGQFRGVRNGYLPALEEKDEVIPELPRNVTLLTLQDGINQLRARLLSMEVRIGKVGVEGIQERRPTGVIPL